MVFASAPSIQVTVSSVSQTLTCIRGMRRMLTARAWLVCLLPDTSGKKNGRVAARGQAEAGYIGQCRHLHIAVIAGGATFYRQSLTPSWRATSPRVAWSAGQLL